MTIQYISWYKISYLILKMILQLFLIFLVENLCLGVKA